MENTEQKKIKKPHIIYSGHFVPEEWLGRFLGPAVSGNRMQLGIINAIKDKCDLSLISTTPIASYPKEKTIRVKKERVSLSEDLKYTKIPFVNIFGIKQLTEIRSLYKALKREKIDVENTVIINYNPYVELAIPVLKFAKRKKIKTVCIVADIPVTVHKHYGRIKKFFRKLEIKNYYKYIGKYDGLIVLNKNVVSEFAEGKKYYLMDGGVTEREIADTKILPPEEHNNNEILYSGALEEYNGIREMIEGFLGVDKDLTFVICGDGALAPYVREMSEKHKNIIYKGRLTREEAIDHQRRSGLLINARPADAFSTRFSLPSKVIEYMLSGTPVLTTRLDGLTEEYDGKLFFIGKTAEEISQGISNFFTLSIEERYERAVLAREFVEKKKTYTYHADGILELVDEVLAE